MTTPTQEAVDQIAVVGMAGRFPGAEDVDELWSLLRQGHEAITRLSRDQVLRAGEDPRLLDDDRYVPAAGLLDHFDCFDAAFFGFSDREARILDPQFRVFLECAWHALEDAGYDAQTREGRVGVFAGSGMNAYLWRHVHGGLFRGPLDHLEARVMNDRDFLTTWTSYKLGLSGPSIGVQTACSTSLVAVHLASQSLLTYESDLAIAGGVTIALPQGIGYVRREGGTMSADGRCLPFDAAASGLVGGSGAGAVVLRRLSDAERAGDRVLGILLASAVNNDGASKAGYTAPSVEGQRRVLRDALEVADVPPASIGYVEAHGTGTPVGDPIEVRALREAYATGSSHHCALGSVKANLGHLDAAAGVASLIKVLLSFEYGEIPPSTYFHAANPLTELDGGPFFVNREPVPWPHDRPARAGVSSFGMGGTNAHVIAEAPPSAALAPARRRHHVIGISASSEAALKRARAALAAHLDRHLELRLQDVSLTLTRRTPFKQRWATAAGDAAELVEQLRTDAVAVQARPAAEVAFLFPGQGAQRSGMAAELYAAEEVFAAELDSCLSVLPSRLRDELRRLLLAPRSSDGDERLRQTALAQPALFAVEYALARQWEAWGVTGDHLIGHSIGEYVAACLAGVFTLEDAATVVAARGSLMQTAPGGDMLAVSSDEVGVADLLEPGVDLAAVNAPAQVVLSGSRLAIDAANARAVDRGLRTKRLATSHAFHSAMLEPILDELRAALAAVPLAPPQRPFFSNVTGRPTGAEDAIAPTYWVRQARDPVRFSDALQSLVPRGVICVEVGPGTGLTSLARLHQRGYSGFAVASLSTEHDPRADGARLMDSLGALWAAGVAIDWPGVHRGQGARVVRLPGYPFERNRYWIDASAGEPAGSPQPTMAAPAVSTMPDDVGAVAEAPPAESRHTSTEAVVAHVFAEAFGVGEVALTDSFFELGGNSLIAAEVVERLRARLGRKVPVRALFDAPRVADLAAFVEALDADGSSRAADEDTLSDLLDDLSSLPPDELDRLLREAGAEP